MKFQILEPYTITLVNQGDTALDSDGRYQLEDGWYAGRPFYLNEGGFDMTWDCGVVLGSGGTTAAAPGGGVSTGDRFAEAPGCSWLVYPLLERWPLAPLYPGKGEPENTNDRGFFSR